MSEAELHVLHARLIGGQRTKASRGELTLKFPVGLVYDAAGRVTLDPDAQVEEALRTFFETFRRPGAATATVRRFREQALLFRRRLSSGPHRGEVAWGPLLHHRALQVLKNPRYAGAFAYGRSTNPRTAHGRELRRPLPREQWHTLILDAHAGYITWPQYEENLRRLRENGQAYGADRRHGPPREGPPCCKASPSAVAAANGCQSAITPITNSWCPSTVPARLHPAWSATRQRVLGGALDRAIGDLLVDRLQPLNLEVTLSIQAELRKRAGEADHLRHLQVEQARYEAEFAQRRYLRVDPDNRLVADSLEAEWNHRLRALVAAQEDYERRRDAEAVLFDEKQRQQVLALATDFPRLWHDPDTHHGERKRMVCLLLEDVTILKADDVLARVRFRGGANSHPPSTASPTRPEVAPD